MLHNNLEWRRLYIYKELLKLREDWRVALERGEVLVNEAKISVSVDSRLEKVAREVDLEENSAFV